MRLKTAMCFIAFVGATMSPPLFAQGHLAAPKNREAQLAAEKAQRERIAAENARREERLRNPLAYCSTDIATFKAEQPLERKIECSTKADFDYHVARETSDKLISPRVFIPSQRTGRNSWTPEQRFYYEVDKRELSRLVELLISCRLGDVTKISPLESSFSSWVKNELDWATTRKWDAGIEYFKHLRDFDRVLPEIAQKNILEALREQMHLRAEALQGAEPRLSPKLKALVLEIAEKVRSGGTVTPAEDLFRNFLFDLPIKGISLFEHLLGPYVYSLAQLDISGEREGKPGVHASHRMTRPASLKENQPRLRALLDKIDATLASKSAPVDSRDLQLTSLLQEEMASRLQSDRAAFRSHWLNDELSVLAHQIDATSTSDINALTRLHAARRALLRIQVMAEAEQVRDAQNQGYIHSFPVDENFSEDTPLIDGMMSQLRAERAAIKDATMPEGLNESEALIEKVVFALRMDVPSEVRQRLRSLNLFEKEVLNGLMDLLLDMERREAITLRKDLRRILFDGVRPHELIKFAQSYSVEKMPQYRKPLVSAIDSGIKAHIAAGDSSPTLRARYQPAVIDALLAKDNAQLDKLLDKDRGQFRKALAEDILAIDLAQKKESGPKKSGQLQQRKAALSVLLGLIDSWGHNTQGLDWLVDDSPDLCGQLEGEIAVLDIALKRESIPYQVELIKRRREALASLQKVILARPHTMRSVPFMDFKRALSEDALTHQYIKDRFDPEVATRGLLEERAARIEYQKRTGHSDDSTDQQLARFERPARHVDNDAETVGFPSGARVKLYETLQSEPHRLMFESLVSRLHSRGWDDVVHQLALNPSKENIEAASKKWDSDYHKYVLQYDYSDHLVERAEAALVKTEPLSDSANAALEELAVLEYARKNGTPIDHLFSKAEIELLWKDHSDELGLLVQEKKAELALKVAERAHLGGKTAEAKRLIEFHLGGALSADAVVEGFDEKQKIARSLSTHYADFMKTHPLSSADYEKTTRFLELQELKKKETKIYEMESALLMKDLQEANQWLYAKSIHSEVAKAEYEAPKAWYALTQEERIKQLGELEAAANNLLARLHRAQGSERVKLEADWKKAKTEHEFKKGLSSIPESEREKRLAELEKAWKLAEEAHANAKKRLADSNQRYATGVGQLVEQFKQQAQQLEAREREERQTHKKALADQGHKYAAEFVERYLKSDFESRGTPAEQNARKSQLTAAVAKLLEERRDILTQYQSFVRAEKHIPGMRLSEFDSSPYRRFVAKMADSTNTLRLKADTVKQLLLQDGKVAYAEFEASEAALKDTLAKLGKLGLKIKGGVISDLEKLDLSEGALWEAFGRDRYKNGDFGRTLSSLEKFGVSWSPTHQNPADAFQSHVISKWASEGAYTNFELSEKTAATAELKKSVEGGQPKYSFRVGFSDLANARWHAKIGLEKLQDSASHVAGTAAQHGTLENAMIETLHYPALGVSKVTGFNGVVVNSKTGEWRINDQPFEIPVTEKTRAFHRAQLEESRHFENMRGWGGIRVLEDGKPSANGFQLATHYQFSQRPNVQAAVKQGEELYKESLRASNQIAAAAVVSAVAPGSSLVQEFWSWVAWDVGSHHLQWLGSRGLYEVRTAMGNRYLEKPELPPGHAVWKSARASGLFGAVMGPVHGGLERLGVHDLVGQLAAVYTSDVLNGQIDYLYGDKTQAQVWSDANKSTLQMAPTFGWIYTGGKWLNRIPGLSMEARHRLINGATLSFNTGTGAAFEYFENPEVFNLQESLQRGAFSHAYFAHLMATHSQLLDVKDRVKAGKLSRIQAAEHFGELGLQAWDMMKVKDVNDGVSFSVKEVPKDVKGVVRLAGKVDPTAKTVDTKPKVVMKTDRAEANVHGSYEKLGGFRSPEEFAFALHLYKNPVSEGGWLGDIAAGFTAHLRANGPMGEALPHIHSIFARTMREGFLKTADPKVPGAMPQFFAERPEISQEIKVAELDSENVSHMELARKFAENVEPGREPEYYKYFQAWVDDLAAEGKATGDLGLAARLFGRAWSQGYRVPISEHAYEKYFGEKPKSPEHQAPRAEPLRLAGPEAPRVEPADQARYEHAKKIMGRAPTAAEWTAVQDAHVIGEGVLGPEGETKYSRPELRKKYEMLVAGLVKAGQQPEQAKALADRFLREGIAGKNFTRMYEEGKFEDLANEAGTRKTTKKQRSGGNTDLGQVDSLKRKYLIIEKEAELFHRELADFKKGLGRDPSYPELEVFCQQFIERYPR